MELNKHVILITGAGGGLGGTAAVTLAKHGAQIILLDNSIPKLEAVYDAIVNAGGHEPIMYPLDLAGATESDYQDMAERIGEKYGALQGLLHSAVAFDHFAPLSQISTKDWWQSLHVNLHAPFLLCRTLLPLLQNSPHASIVMTSDSYVRTAPAYSGAYGVAKIGLEGLAKILAEELEADQRVRVNTLIPGPVNSPLRKRAYPAEDKSRLPDMDSLAAAYLYLFSAQSLGVTGQTLDARTFHL